MKSYLGIWTSTSNKMKYQIPQHRNIKSAEALQDISPAGLLDLPPTRVAGLPGQSAVPGTPWMTRTFNLPKWYNSSPSFRKMVRNSELKRLHSSTSASKLATLDMCDQLRLPALYIAGNGVNCFPGIIPAASWRAKQRSSLRQYNLDRAARYGSIEESVVPMVDLGKRKCQSESIPLCTRLRSTG